MKKLREILGLVAYVLTTFFFAVVTVGYIMIQLSTPILLIWLLIKLILFLG